MPPERAPLTLKELGTFAAEREWAIDAPWRAQVHDAVLTGVSGGVAWRLSSRLWNLEGAGMDELTFETGPIPGAERVELAASSRTVGGATAVDLAVAVATAAVRLIRGRRRPDSAAAADPEAPHPHLPELAIHDPLGILLDPALAELIRAAPHDGAQPVTDIRNRVVAVFASAAGCRLVCQGRLDHAVAVDAAVAAGTALIARLRTPG